MGVYTKVPRSHAKNLDARVWGAMWLDINKGDAKSPNYRARLVGKEFNTGNRLDLFAATPPLEILRMIASRCASILTNIATTHIVF